MTAMLRACCLQVGFKPLNLHGLLRWDAYGWMRPSAYTLFGLSPPWEKEGAAFRTTESGQMLMNRCEW